MSKTNLTTYVESQKAVVESQLAQEVLQVETDTTTRVTGIESQLAQRQADLTAYAEDQRPNHRLLHRRSHVELTRNLKQRRKAEGIGEAEASRYPGEEDPKPDQRAAPGDAARESAADIRDKASYCRRSAIQG